MGKLILLPGVDLDPPSRAELVDELSEMMLKEVTSVFIEHQMEPGPLAAWNREIRDYFWWTEIKLENRDFQFKDLKRWTSHWRGQALEAIRARQIR